MADFGAIGIAVKLMGGAQVLKELKDIRTAAKELEAKPFQLKVDVSQVVSAQKQIADAKAKMGASDKEAVKDADFRLKSERELLSLYQRQEKEAAKRAANLAKASDATVRRSQAEEQAQRKMVGLQMQAQKEVDTLVTKQAMGFQRAIASIEKEQAARQKSVEQQAMGFQRAIADVDKYQKAVQLAKNETINNFLNGLSSGLTRAGGAWDGIIRGVSRFSDGLTHAGQVAATFAYRMTLISAPFDILLAKSFQFTTQLEMGLAKVATQLDGTASKMRSFMGDAKTQILGLQGTYGVSANQQADALYYLISSGVSEKQAQASLEPITKLSAVAQTPAGTIAQGVTAALNVFGDELERFPDLTERTTYALGVMFEATKKGRFEFGDFATQFGRAAEQVKMGGGSFEDAAAMLAALSQVFTPSQATTALNSFVKAVVDPTKEATAALKELDVELYKGGKRRSLPDVFDELFGKIGATAQGDQEKADKAINAIFGDLRGGRAAQFFLDPKNQDLYKRIKEGLGSGQDSIAEGWKLTSEQIQTQINIVIGKFYELGGVAVDYLKPAIKGGLEGLKVFFDGLAQNPQVVGIITQVAAAMAVLAPTMLVLGTALMGVGGIVTAIATLMSPAYLIGFGLAWEALAPSIGKAATAIEFFGGGITGILATVTEFARQMGLIKDTDADKIFKALGVEQNLGGIQSVTEFIGELKELAPDVTRIRDGIMGVAEGIGLLIDNISNGKGILGGFATAIKGIAGGLGGLGLGGAEGFAGIVDKVIGVSLIAKIGGALVGALAKIVVGVQNVTAGQVNVAGLNPFAGGTGNGQFVGANGLPAGGSSATGTGATLGAPSMGWLNGAITLISSFFVGQMWSEGAMDKRDARILELLKQGLTSGEILKDSLKNPNMVGAQFATTTENDILRVASANGINISTDNVDIKSGALTSSGNSSGLATPNDIRTFATLPQTRPATDLLTGAVGVVRNFIDNTGSALDELAAKAYGAAEALANVDGSGVPTGYGAPPEPGAGYGDYARSQGLNDFYSKLYPDVVKFTADKSNQYVAGITAASAASKKFADAAVAAAEKLTNAIRGFVQDLVSPSAVTQEDLDAAKNGTYKEKPDELRRRLEAVGTGTDPAQYGEQFAKQYAFLQGKFPGKGAGDLAGMFGSGELFAGLSPEETMGLWNQDALQQGIMSKIMGSIGQSKLIDTIMNSVLSGLSPDLLSQFGASQGLGEGVGLDAIKSKFVGQEFGIGKDAGIAGQLDEETVSKFSNFANILDRIKDAANIVVKVTFDPAKWEAAAKEIEKASDFIKEKLIAFSDIFIQITAKFSDESGGGGTTGTGTGTGGETTTGTKVDGDRATGGYVNNGIYQLGEQGYEYVLPHRMVRWMEKILGGKISSPEAIQWLIGALGGGKENTMTHLGLWASGVTGVSTPLPEDADKWFNNIKVLGRDKKKMGYADFLWQKGQPASGGSSGGGGGGGSGGGSGGGGGSIDFGAFDSAVTRFAKAVDLLLAGLNYNPQFGAMGRGGGGNGVNIGVLNLSAPNGATFEMLNRDIRSNAAHGRD